MDLSFKEKSLIVSLLLTLLIFGYYFIGVLSNHGEGRHADFDDIIRIIIVFVVLEAVIHTFLASIDKSQTDERDRHIEKLSYRNGYLCLSIGIWFLIGQTFVGEATNDLAGWVNEYFNLLSPYILANLLLMFFILSEVTMFFTQLYYYRKGV